VDAFGEGGRSEAKQGETDAGGSGPRAGAPPLLALMSQFNRGLHLMLGAALMVGSVMVMGLFITDVYSAVTHRTLAAGFLHALGSLLILWTFSELINSELRYLSGGRVEVAVFIEVALAATIRHVLVSTTEPLDVNGSLITMGMILVLGVAYGIVAVSQPNRRGQEAPRVH